MGPHWRIMRCKIRGGAGARLEKCDAEARRCGGGGGGGEEATRVWGDEAGGDG